MNTETKQDMDQGTPDHRETRPDAKSPTVQAQDQPLIATGGQTSEANSAVSPAPLRSTAANGETSLPADFAGLPWGIEVEPWPEPVDGKYLLDYLAWVFGRHVVVPQWGEQALALWTLHTYAYSLRDVTTYLGIESPEKRCGKTTLLAVLSELVNRPVVAANISPPAFFRVIEEARPTLLIDEADTFLRGNDELRGILNSGYHRKTAYVLRVANELAKSKNQPPKGRDRPEAPNSPADADQAEFRSASTGRASQLARFSCWCPKAVAAIGRLPDTLANRCIIIRMQRKTAGEQCDRLCNLQPAALRQQCVRFVLDHAAAIATARPQIPPALNDRAADIWEPLLALADLAGGPWPEVARNAAVALSRATMENNAIEWLFGDIWIAFCLLERERIFSRDLVARLNEAGDRPWSELRNGKPITDRWLSRRLRPYGVQPRTMWIGKAAAKGYFKDDFEEAFHRYLPYAELRAWIAQMPAEQPGEAEHTAECSEADTIMPDSAASGTPSEP